ncbi:LysR family transcriptional regulator [Quadrisphaera setariae]|uniref:LysR family transcriptional regulator n=1 Tax=Quadrisphaera setariae TaxID=2593304 RepID=UPI0016505327|nr:LysR family transcriptional regulator [Quadrisphaera setariae]
MIDPWKLRMLVQLDALGTVRAVAESLHLSPSTVSQQLAALEREVRAPLLERSGRRVRLTEAGRVLAARGRDLLAGMASARAELDALDGEPTGTVRLAAFQSAVAPLCLPAVATLRVSHPRLHVELAELEPHEAPGALLTDTADVVVTTTDDPRYPWSAELEVVPVGSDPLVLLLPPDHPLAQAPTPQTPQTTPSASSATAPVDLAACADEWWACDRPGSYMDDQVRRLCGAAGFAPRVAARFSTYLLLVQHVAAGLAVGVLPALAVPQDGRVAVRQLAAPAHREVAAVLRRGARRRAGVAAVLEALLDHPPVPGLSALR